MKLVVCSRDNKDVVIRVNSPYALYISKGMELALKGIKEVHGVDGKTLVDAAYAGFEKIYRRFEKQLNKDVILALIREHEDVAPDSLYEEDAMFAESAVLCGVKKFIPDYLEGLAQFKLANPDIPTVTLVSDYEESMKQQENKNPTTEETKK